MKTASTLALACALLLAGLFSGGLRAANFTVLSSKGAGLPAVGATLAEGSTVTTQAGQRIVLTTPGGWAVTVEEKSSVVLTELSAPKSGKEKTEIELKSGTVFAMIKKGAPLSYDFKVRSPTLVAAARGTAFSVFYNGRTTVVKVAQGLVSVTGLGTAGTAGFSTQVAAGQYVEAPSDSTVGQLSPADVATFKNFLDLYVSLGYLSVIEADAVKAELDAILLDIQQNPNNPQYGVGDPNVIGAPGFGAGSGGGEINGSQPVITREAN